MNVCSICGVELESISYDDTVFCYNCMNEVYTIETTEIETALIDDYYLGISYFDFLDIRKQYDFILDSIGSKKEKRKKLKHYLKLERNAVKKFMKEVKGWQR